MMKKLMYGAIAIMPTFAFAALEKLDSLVTDIGKLTAKVIPIMFALAIIYFFWGLIQFIRGAGDPKRAAEGKSIMIYGVIAIAVMISIYGLVTWLQDATGVDKKTSLDLPTVKGL